MSFIVDYYTISHNNNQLIFNNLIGISKTSMKITNNITQNINRISLEY
jgi:hypothetical protein